MPLKESTGNMYPWITHTWNPVRGKCEYECSYCYVHRWGYSSSPIYLDESWLRDDLGKGNYIFVCSGCDLFASKVSNEWRQRVFDYTRSFPDNKYLWHTKNPDMVLKLQEEFTNNDTLCVTIESNIPWPGISKAPQPFKRFEYLKRLSKRRMITVEPAMDFDVMTFSDMIIGCEPYQVNIGADGGHNHLPEPSREKIEELIELLAPHTKVYLKKNLRRLLPGHELYER
jgi:protein gp37